MSSLFSGSDSDRLDNEIQEMLPGALEALESFDFEEAFGQIDDLDDVRGEIRDMFVGAGRGEPMPWEELAALALFGLAKGL